MKYFITAFIGACTMCACHPSAPDTTTTTAVAPDSTEYFQTMARRSLELLLLGTYKSDFGGSPIYITINYCNGNKLAGYNSHKGLRRNVSGTFINKGNKLEIVLSEPGDHAYDGVFSLIMDSSLVTGSGTWKPSNNKSLGEKQLAISRVERTGNELGFFSGDHCDVLFEEDGSCLLNYYEKVNDSTFSEQMTTVRGTWEQKSKEELFVNWQANPAYQQRSTTFAITYATSGSYEYIRKMTGDNFVFTPDEY